MHTSSILRLKITPQWCSGLSRLWTSVLWRICFCFCLPVSSFSLMGPTLCLDRVVSPLGQVHISQYKLGFRIGIRISPRKYRDFKFFQGDPELPYRKSGPWFPPGQIRDSPRRLCFSSNHNESFSQVLPIGWTINHNRTFSWALWMNVSENVALYQAFIS